MSDQTGTTQHWTITVHGWGTCYFLGTEAQAEEWRRHKARWERAVAKKRPSTPEEIGQEKFKLAEHLLGLERPGVEAGNE